MAISVGSSRSAHMRTAGLSRGAVVPRSGPVPVSRIRVNAGKRGAPCAALKVSSAEAAGEPKYVDSEGRPVQAPEKAALVAVDGVVQLPIAPGVTLLRGTTHNRLKVDVEYGLNAGSCDNSYLVVGRSARVVVDVPDEAYLADWLSQLKALLANSGGAAGVTDLVITHLSPFRIPALRAFLSLRASEGRVDKLRIHLSNPAAQVLQAGVGADEDGRALLKYGVDVRPVKAGGGEVPLGTGAREVLQLGLVPSPRWPDLMTAYYPREQLLFSSKLFSAHVAPPDAADPFDSAGQAAFVPHWRHFFDTTLAPVARQALEASKKLGVVPSVAPRGVWASTGVVLGKWAGLIPSVAPKDERPTRILAPLHGPVVKQNVPQLLNSYDRWLALQLEAQDKCEVAVFYASAYGNTTSIAQAVAHGLTRSGMGVSVVNLETATAEEVAEAVQRCRGFAIGSPTLGGHMPTQVQAALGVLLQQPSVSLLPCGVFGSFGWSGEAVDEIAGKLRDAGFAFAFDPIRVKFKPSQDTLLACEQAGVALATEVRKVQRRRETGVVANAARQTAASQAQLAMGRVVGPLCVVTARDSDATGAMLASWVSQASFNPPGITVAVKRDRSLEPMLMRGASFSLSVLAEGPNSRKAMRQLSRPHAAGADRLAGLDTFDAPGNGCPVVEGAAAYLECTVSDRMEAGDHFAVLASVVGGDVTDAGAVPAVHHRKVGNHY